MRITLDAQMRLIVQEGADERRENLPVVSEVAAVIADEYADRCYKEIVWQSVAIKEMSVVSAQSILIMLLIFPWHMLLFPHGGHGFHW
jgi:hypothetical protein